MHADCVAAVFPAAAAAAAAAAAGCCGHVTDVTACSDKR